MKKTFKEEMARVRLDPRENRVKLDGHHAYTEIIGYGITMALFFVGGVFSAIGLLAAGYDLSTAGRAFFIVLCTGVVLVLFRVSVENVYAIFHIGKQPGPDPIQPQGPPEIRRPIVLRRPEPPVSVVELPNGETIETELLSDFFQTVANRGGKTWSREYWTNDPSDPSRPGLNEMSQNQWRGLKELFDRIGLWRSENKREILQALDRVINDG